MKTILILTAIILSYLYGLHHQTPSGISYEDAVRVAYAQGVHDGQESLVMEVINGELQQVRVASAK